MTNEQTEFVKKCIREDNLHVFYTWRAWLKVRANVLKKDKYECQECKKRGFYKEATTVHHINFVKKRPDLALDEYYEDECGVKKRNLISLCHDCHEMAHGYRSKSKKKEPLTLEKW